MLSLDPQATQKSLCQKLSPQPGIYSQKVVGTFKWEVLGGMPSVWGLRCSHEINGLLYYAVPALTSVILFHTLGAVGPVSDGNPLKPSQNKPVVFRGLSWLLATVI